MTALNQHRSATTRAKDPRGGWLRATRRGRQASRRLLLRRESTRTKQQIGWASGHGAAVPKVCRRRRAGRGACARRWRRARPSTPPARPRRASQCASRRSATSASYRRHHQWRRRQSRKRQRRRRRRRPWRRRRILAASAADTSAATSTRGRGPRACSLGTSRPTKRLCARGHRRPRGYRYALARAPRRPRHRLILPWGASSVGATRCDKCYFSCSLFRRVVEKLESKRTVANDNRNTA
jgi:hypothetical protein